jgi:hypothetical protein
MVLNNKEEKAAHKNLCNFNIRSETLKLVQEKAGNTLELIGIGNNFLNRTQWLSN